MRSLGCVHIKSEAMRYDAMSNDKIYCNTSVRGVQIKCEKAKRRPANSCDLAMRFLQTFLIASVRCDKVTWLIFIKSHEPASRRMKIASCGRSLRIRAIVYPNIDFSLQLQCTVARCTFTEVYNPYLSVSGFLRLFSSAGDSVNSAQPTLTHMIFRIYLSGLIWNRLYLSLIHI